MLAMCKSLRTLRLGLFVSNIFGNDAEALKLRFVEGQPLLSPGLESLANTITSLRQLNNLHLDFISSEDRGQQFDAETKLFLQFAFSGMREVLLWMEIKGRLRANHIHEIGERRKFNGRTFVWVNHRYRIWYREGDDTTDYATWVQWHAEKYPGGVDAEGVASIPLGHDDVGEGSEV